MDYSVVIVARDHARQLLAALLALRQQAHPAEVILVDNASRADLRGATRLAQLPVRYLRLPRHRSLAAAYNAGLDAATCEAVLLLHADVILESEPSSAVQFLVEQPQVGVVGGKLYRDATVPRHVLHAGYDVPRGRLAAIATTRAGKDVYHAVSDVPAVSDACMVVRRCDLRFDERYWFRLQDVDLCFQYRQRGERVVILPDLRAIHLESGGVNEHLADPSWAIRQLAAQLLYHERWCSDLALEVHPRQTSVRGAAALEYLREVDEGYRLPQGAPVVSEALDGAGLASG